MEITLLSGVRNRKVAHVPPREPCLSFDGTEILPPPQSACRRLWDYLGGSVLLRNFHLRVHKFSFQWDLALHLSTCIFSLLPFAISGNRLCVVLPILVWAFYNFLFLLPTRRADRLVPGFSRFKHSFTASIEEFFSPKLLPILSVSYLFVALSLSVTGRRLGGPPLCYSTCKKCLGSWSESVEIDINKSYTALEKMIQGCGHENGKELLAYYTMSQTSFTLFVTVIIAMAACMAWRVAEDEREEMQQAEEWLKREDPKAFAIRNECINKQGGPATFIRPEGNAVWVCFGIVAALTFTLLGWHNWSVLPSSRTASLLIILNHLTILTSTLVLHLGFFGRLLSLYQRNFSRVQHLTYYLNGISESELDAWWNARSFVLNDDLAIDYDIGGLAVSATFLINVMVFLVLVSQTVREGFAAMMEAPGSYCAYACLYITMCLIKIFTLATSTFEEQYRHITGLQRNTIFLTSQSNSSMRMLGGYGMGLEKSWSYDFDAGGLYVESDFGSDNGINSESVGGLVGQQNQHSHVLDIGGESHDLSSSNHDVNHQHQFHHSTSPRSASGNFSGVSIDCLPPSHPAAGLSHPPTPTSSSMSAPSSSSASVSMANTNTNIPPLSLPLASSSSDKHAPSPKEGSMENFPGIDPVSISRTSSNSNFNCKTPVHLTRAMSQAGNIEARRQTLAEMISQIRKYDPYPCILGIPVMPALFATCKFYIFVCFLLIGSRIMVSCLRMLRSSNDL